MNKSSIRSRSKSMGFTFTDVLNDLKEIRDYLGGYENEEISDGENVGTDVRLNSHGRGFQIFSGDSSYDQDHRGFWGSSFVSKHETDEGLKEIAYDLMEQLLEQKDMEKSNHVE